MAGGPFYLFDSVASGSSHGLLQDGGAAPAAATTGTGWTVGTTVAGPDYSLTVYGTKKLASTFAAGVQPTGAPGTNNCWRTQFALSGTYPAANWTLAMAFISVANAMSGTGHLRISVWASPDPTGQANARQIAAAFDFTAFSNSSVGTPQNTTFTWAAPAIALNGEYLFFKPAWEITVASGNAAADVLYRQDGTNSKLTPPAFTPTTLPKAPPRPPFTSGPYRHFVPTLPPIANPIIASGSVPTITLTAPSGTALTGSTVAATGNPGTPNPVRGPNVAGPNRYFLTRAPPPLGQQTIAQGSLPTVTLTAPIGQPVSALGLTSALGPSPFGGLGRTAGPFRHWAAPPVQLGGNAANVSGSIPTITLISPLGGAVATQAAQGTASPLPWRGPITQGPTRTFLPKQAPQGQQVIAQGAGPTLTLTPPLGGAVATLGLTSPMGPARFQAPLTVGPFRTFFVPQSSPPGQTTVATGSIPSIALAPPLGVALVPQNRADPFPWRGPDTYGPQRIFPRLISFGITAIGKGASPTVTLTPPQGQAITNLGTATPLPWRGPTTRGPRRQFVAYGQAFAYAVVAAGTLPTITITPPSGAAMAYRGTDTPAPWRGPDTQGPARRFPGMLTYGLVGTGPVAVSGAIGTVTLSAPQGSAIAAQGTASPFPWRGPTTIGPMRQFVPVPPIAAFVSRAAPLGTIVLTPPSGAAIASSNVVEIAVAGSYLGLSLDPSKNPPIV